MRKFVETRLRNWYFLLLLGVITFFLGVWVLFAPLSAFLTLSIFFSIGLLISGIIEIAYSLYNRQLLRNWTWSLGAGIFSIILGLHLLLRPELSILILNMYIGFWMMFRSVMYVAGSVDLKSYGLRHWPSILLMGVVGCILSFILLFNPKFTSFIISSIMGAGLIVLGLLQMLLSWGLRKIKHKIKRHRQNIEDVYIDAIEVE